MAGLAAMGPTALILSDANIRSETWMRPVLSLSLKLSRTEVPCAAGDDHPDQKL